MATRRTPPIAPPDHPLLDGEREALVAEMSALHVTDDDAPRPPWPERSPGEAAARALRKRIEAGIVCADPRPDGRPRVHRADAAPLCPGCQERAGLAHDVLVEEFRARLA